MDGRLASAAPPCCCATRVPRPAAPDAGVGARMDEEKLLPIYGEVAQRAGGAEACTTSKLLPIYGEVARRAGGAGACITSSIRAPDRRRRPGSKRYRWVRRAASRRRESPRRGRWLGPTLVPPTRP